MKEPKKYLDGLSRSLFLDMNHRTYTVYVGKKVYRYALENSLSDGYYYTPYGRLKVVKKTDNDEYTEKDKKKLIKKLKKGAKGNLDLINTLVNIMYPLKQESSNENS